MTTSWAEVYATVRRRWQIVAVLGALIITAWWFRYDVQRCEDRHCVVLDRWTGEIRYQRATLVQ
jgi:hypothetical protein